MKIWKMFGLNTRETRERMNQDNNKANIEQNQNTNWHSTIQWIAGCVALAVTAYACSGNF